MGTSKNNKGNGHSGINIFKNDKPWLLKPITKVVKVKVKDIKKIAIIWLVKAMLNGVKLSKFKNKTKLNNVNIKGK